MGGGVAGDDEDPGADHAGDPEQGEAEGAERVRVQAFAIGRRGGEDRVEVAHTRWRIGGSSTWLSTGTSRNPSTLA